MDWEWAQESLKAFGGLLHDHTRKEERSLFPALEEGATEEVLATVGADLERALPPRSCRTRAGPGS